MALRSSGPMNGTNMRATPTITTSKEAGLTGGTSPRYQLPLFPTMTYSVADFHARLSAWQAVGGDLKKPEAHSFLISLGFSRTKDPSIWYSKTSKVSLTMTAEKLSRSSLGFSPSLGMALNGAYLIKKISAYRRIEKGSTLSDILETDVPSKYFLSEKATATVI